MVSRQQTVVNLPISTTRAPLDSKKHFVYVQHIKDPATLQHKELVEATVPKFLEDIRNFACVFEIIVVTGNESAPVCPAARCSPSYQAYCPIIVEQLSKIKESDGNTKSTRNVIESNWYTAHLIEMEPASEACLQPVSPAAKKRGTGSIHSSVSKQREPLNVSNSFSSRDVQIINVPKHKGSLPMTDFVSPTPQLISCLEGMSLNKVTLRQYQDLYADIQLEHFNHQRCIETPARNHKSCQRQFRLVSTSYPLTIQSHH